VDKNGKEVTIGETKAMKGGEGSGNFGHAGRPGEVGGSAAGGGIINNMINRLNSKYGLDVKINMYSHEGSGTLATGRREVSGGVVTGYTINVNESEIYNGLATVYDGTPEGIIIHEYGHLLTPTQALFLDEKDLNYLMKNAVSEYAMTKPDEALAELFVFYERGGKVDDRLKSIFNKAARKDIMK
jgi:hypothetical protein